MRSLDSPRSTLKPCKGNVATLIRNFCTLDILVRDMTERHAVVAEFLLQRRVQLRRHSLDCATDMNVHPPELSFEPASARTEHLNPLLHDMSASIGKTCASARSQLNMRPVLISGWTESQRFTGHENTIIRQLCLPMGKFGSVHREHRASRVLSENLSIRRFIPVCGSS